MTALNLTFTKVKRLRIEIIWRSFIGQIDRFLDFVNFFSPFVLFRYIRLFRYEFINIKGYFVTLIVLIVTFYSIILFGQIVESRPYLFLTVPVIISALYGGIGPAIFSITGSVLLANFIEQNFILNSNLLRLTPTNLAFILEGMFISWISITQKRRQQGFASNLLQEQHARLKAQNTSLNLKRLERQKDDFIAIAAHELKNPLASIRAFTQILKGHTHTESSKQYLTKLEQQTERLNDLVSQLFDVSSMTSGKISLKKSMVDFDEFLMTTVIDLQHTISTHKLVIAGHTKSEVSLDPDRIEQVIANLILNAVKYSPQANQVIIQLTANNSQVTVAVNDFGEGIDPIDQRRIFERFYRVSNATTARTSGLGLGLYIVAEIVKLHGGKIWLASTLGKGSTFAFSLPKD